MVKHSCPEHIIVTECIESTRTPFKKAVYSFNRTLNIRQSFMYFDFIHISVAFLSLPPAGNRDS